MLLSIYTFVRDGIYLDYHVVQMLKHHLPLADEIIVNEGYSRDDTYRQISHIDPKIKVFRSNWGKPKGGPEWLVSFKNEARQRCSGEWCWMLDCDEFVPEWEFAPIREALKRTPKTILSSRVTNFYGNYKVFHQSPEKVVWPSGKMNIHRNLPDVEVWGDGCHVRLKNEPFQLDPCWAATIHHFGFVRSPARLRQKWRLLTSLYLRKRWRLPLPSFLFDWKPHDWMDPELLEGLMRYEGPYIRAVREDPAEFVRDDFKLHDYLLRRGAAASNPKDTP